MERWRVVLVDRAGESRLVSESHKLDKDPRKGDILTFKGADPPHVTKARGDYKVAKVDSDAKQIVINPI